MKERKKNDTILVMGESQKALSLSRKDFLKLAGTTTIVTVAALTLPNFLREPVAQAVNESPDPSEQVLPEIHGIDPYAKGPICDRKGLSVFESIFAEQMLKTKENQEPLKPHGPIEKEGKETLVYSDLQGVIGAFAAETLSQFGVTQEELLTASPQFLKEKLNTMNPNILTIRFVVPDTIIHTIEDHLEELGATSAKEWFEAHILIFNDMLREAGIRNLRIKMKPLIRVRDDVIVKSTVLPFKHQDPTKGQTSENWRQTMVTTTVNEHEEDVVVNHSLGDDVLVMMSPIAGSNYPIDTGWLTSVFVESLGKQMKLDGGAVHAWLGHLTTMNWGDLYDLMMERVFNGDARYFPENVYPFVNDVMCLPNSLIFSPVSAIITRIFHEQICPDYRSVQTDVMLRAFLPMRTKSGEIRPVRPDQVFPPETRFRFYAPDGSLITRDFGDKEDFIREGWFILREDEVVDNKPILFDPQVASGGRRSNGSTFIVDTSILAGQRPDLVDTNLYCIRFNHVAFKIGGFLLYIPQPIINVGAINQMYGSGAEPNPVPLKLDIHFRQNPEELLPQNPEDTKGHDLFVYTTFKNPIIYEEGQDPDLKKIIAHAKIPGPYGAEGPAYVVWSSERIPVDTLPKQEAPIIPPPLNYRVHLPLIRS